MVRDAAQQMRLAGYVPLAERGFAMPTFERADVTGNARYVAIPEIEGDHLAPISDFEPFDGPATLPLTAMPLARPGTSWLDVFVWSGSEVVGTAVEIFEALHDRHKEIGAEAPLTFLDLALAAGWPGTPAASAEAFAFLRRILGRDGAERTFREIVVRPGVAIEIRRSLHRLGDPVAFGATVGFDVVHVSEKAFHVALDGDVLRRVGTGAAFAELRAGIARFGDAIGFGVDILAPPPSPTPDPEGEVAAIVEQEYGQPVPRGGRGTRSRLLGLAREMALDLGTNNTRVHARGRGVVLTQPSVIAISFNSGVRKVIAVGDEAQRAVDRVPSGVEVIRPLRDGVIVDLDAAVAMLREFLRRARRGGLLPRPLDLIVCIPSGSTALERRSLREAATKAGASRVWFVEAPLAAAVGAGLPVSGPVGSMLIQVGGGTTEVAVLAMRGIAYTTSIRVGGDAMDDAIVNSIRRNHNLLIGLRTAERVKREIGSAQAPMDGVGRSTFVRGRDLVNGVPKEIEVSAAQIAEYIAEPVASVIEGARVSLENTAPELAADIVEGGIILTGGGAMLHGLDAAIRDETGLPVRVAQDPANCVTLGLARMLEEPNWRTLLQRP